MRTDSGDVLTFVSTVNVDVFIYFRPNIPAREVVALGLHPRPIAE